MYSLKLKSCGSARYMVECFFKSLGCKVRWDEADCAIVEADFPLDRVRVNAMQDWRVARFVPRVSKPRFYGGLVDLSAHALARLTKLIKKTQNTDAIRLIYECADKIAHSDVRGPIDADSTLRLLFEYFDGLPGSPWPALLKCTYEDNFNIDEERPVRLSYTGAMLIYLSGEKAIHVPLTEQIMSTIAERLDILRTQHCRHNMKFLFCDDRAKQFPNKKALLKYLG